MLVSSPVTADAAITSKPNVALSVMTADCLPIFLAHQDGDEIAAIHGGWRPLASDIIRHTLNKMTTVSSEHISGLVGALYWQYRHLKWVKRLRKHLPLLIMPLPQPLALKSPITASFSTNI